MTYPMFDLLIDGVLVIGPNKEVYYCNPAGLNLFEISAKQMISGRPIYDLITFGDSDLFLMKNGPKGEKQQTGYIEVTFETKNGKKGLVQVAILPTKETFGRNKLWFVYLHDVTLEERLHRKYRGQIEQKEQTYAALSQLLGEVSSVSKELVKSLNSNSTAQSQKSVELSQTIETQIEEALKLLSR